MNNQQEDTHDEYFEFDEVSIESFGISGIQRLLGNVRITEENKIIKISGISVRALFLDIRKHYQTSKINSNLFINVKSSSLALNSFFAIEFKYIIDSLYKVTSTQLGKRTYAKLINEMNINTWIGRLNKETPSIFNMDKVKEIKYSLLKHQASFIQYYDKIVPRYGLRGLLMAAEPGAGKTLTSIAIACAYEAEHVIVISPKNAVFKVWEGTLKNDMAVEQTTWVSASGEPLPFINNCRWYIFHYEALEKAVELANTIRNKKCTIILDESHNLNDMKSLRTQRFIDLCQLMNRSIVVELSGTPMKAIGFEAIPLIKAIDPLFTDTAMDSFRKMYGKDAKKAIEILANRLGIIMYKVSQEEAKIPQPVEHDIKVKVPDADRFLLKTIKDNMVNFVKERTEYYKAHKARFEYDYNEAMNIAKPIVGGTDQWDDYNLYIEKFRKHGYDQFLDKDKSVFCNNYELGVIMPVLPPDVRRRFKDARSVIKYVDLKIRGECLGTVLTKARSECNIALSNAFNFSEIIDNSEKKTLIFTSYVNVVKSTQERLKADGYEPLVVHGEVNHELPQIVKKFAEDENANPLIATYQSLSTAVPLIMANSVILLNAPFRVHEKAQTVARANRLGQDKTVHVYNLFLDTGTEPNISTRSLDILKWSEEQVNLIMGFDNNIDVGVEV